MNNNDEAEVWTVDLLLESHREFALRNRYELILEPIRWTPGCEFRKRKGRVIVCVGYVWGQSTVTFFTRVGTLMRWWERLLRPGYLVREWDFREVMEVPVDQVSARMVEEFVLSEMEKLGPPPHDPGDAIL